MSSTVRYGDIVMLYFQGKTENGTTMHPSHSNIMSPKGKGFLSSAGFTDSGLYYSSWMDNFDVLASGMNIKDTFPQTKKCDFRSYLFTITPKLNFGVHEECDKIFKIYKSILKSIKLKSGMDRDLEDMKKNMESRLTVLAKGLEKEKHDNNLLITE